MNSSLKTLCIGSALSLVLACSSNEVINLQQSGLRICIPNDQIHCPCANGQNGLKRCNEDGSGFGECLVDGKTSCDQPTQSSSSSGSMPVRKCGDGTVDPGEACDDGNQVDGDLCSSSCLPVGDPMGAGTCPGMEVHLWGTEEVEGSANNLPYLNSHKATKPCNLSMGLYGNDRVFAVTAHKTGTLHVETPPASYDVVLFVQTKCDDNTTEVACSNVNYQNNGAEKLDTPIMKGQTLFVIVDGGPTSSSGDTRVLFSIK